MTQIIDQRIEGGAHPGGRSACHWEWGIDRRCKDLDGEQDSDEDGGAEHHEYDVSS